MPEQAQPLLLGIDTGTQSARVGICDTGGRFLASASRPYATSYPEPGWAAQDPWDWWAGICGATRDCLQKAGVDGRRLAGGFFLRPGSEGPPLQVARESSAAGPAHRFAHPGGRGGAGPADRDPYRGGRHRCPRGVAGAERAGTVQDGPDHGILQRDVCAR